MLYNTNALCYSAKIYTAGTIPSIRLRFLFVVLNRLYQLLIVELDHSMVVLLGHSWIAAK